MVSAMSLLVLVVVEAAAGRSGRWVLEEELEPAEVAAAAGMDWSSTKHEELELEVEERRLRFFTTTFLWFLDDFVFCSELRA